MSENNNTDLNEVFEEEMDDSTVITVPIDETLSNSGEAADAAAVGAALALKADKDELPATIKVNGQQADNQGLILINGTHIPVSGTNQKTLAQAVEEATEMTAETLPMSSDQGAETVAQKISDMAEDITELQQAGERTAENIPMETGSTTTIKNAIETLDRKAVKSVNRKLPDAAGDVDLSVVPLAENLQSDKLQSIEGEFIIRTTGGNGSVSDGKAYPQHIYGNCEHNGYVAEVLNMTVIPITRTEPDEPITATIDRDTFVAAVDESSTINLYYTTEWSEDPADYGVTVTGDPVAGDQITIVYVKEQRGTILVADPDRLVGTGWNLFNANDGYARVVKYSDVYGYKIGGTYTSLAFSATLTGDRTSLLPNANGLFNVPSDGYVFVTGGNGTDTYILATWSDWTEGPSTGYWEAYRESGIDLSAVVETYFPYGMLKIGTVRDEIDLVAKRSISRIERMVYSEENRAAAAATGRSYDFDENNIYIVREESVQNAITISGEYSVSEHGLEWFTETVLPMDTEILYGKNLRDKLERDVLTISPQNLVAEEQAQVRRNIGVMDPPLNGNGTAAQLLKTNGDGTTEWTTQGTPTDAQVGTAVSAWLTAHPEATTTVQDGAISRAKLNDDLKAKMDAVPDLKSALGFEWIPDIEGKTATERKNSVYASSDGVYVIQTDPSSILYADIYEVEYGKKYLIFGSARIGANGFALIAFNDTVPSVTGSQLKEVIQTGTTTVTAYSVEYAPTQDGYLFVFGGNNYDWGSLSVKQTAVGDSARLIAIEDITANVVDYEKTVNDIELTGLYISADMIIATANLILYYIPVISGKTYRIVYNNHALYSNQYGAVAFSTDVPAALVPVTVLVWGTTDPQNIDYSFTPKQNGYLVVAKAAKSGATAHTFSIKLNKWYDLPNSLKIQTFGDSITDNVNNTWAGHETWVIKIQNVLLEYDITLTNSAWGGSKLTSGADTSVVNRVQTLLDNTSDVVTVWGGTNDWADGVAIGSMSDGATTVMGAVKAIIEYLSEHTTAAIVFATPMQRYNNVDAERETNAAGEPLNSGGKTLKEYCDAIQTVCDFYGIDCVRMDKINGINRINIRSFAADGLHPSTDLAYTRLASIFGTEIERLVK